MPEDLPPFLECVRVVWVYRGAPTSAWQSEEVQFGLSVAPYARAEVPPTTAGTVILDRRWIKPSALRFDHAAYRVLYGWERWDDSDVAQAGVESQLALLVAARDLAIGIRSRLGTGYRLARIELRPQNERLTTDTPATTLTPLDTEGDPTGLGLQIPQAAYLVRSRTLRRGSHGRGLTYVGPPSSGRPGNDALITSTDRSWILGAFRQFSLTARTPQNVLQTSAWCPIVWQKGSRLGAVIRSYAMPDQVGVQRSRAQQRTPLVTELAI